MIIFSRLVLSPRLDKWLPIVHTQNSKLNWATLSDRDVELGGSSFSTWVIATFSYYFTCVSNWVKRSKAWSKRPYKRAESHAKSHSDHVKQLLCNKQTNMSDLNNSWTWMTLNFMLHFPDTLYFVRLKRVSFSLPCLSRDNNSFSSR